jgi:hypothetical protein
VNRIGRGKEVYLCVRDMCKTNAETNKFSPNQSYTDNNNGCQDGSAIDTSCSNRERSFRSAEKSHNGCHFLKKNPLCEFGGAILETK